MSGSGSHEAGHVTDDWWRDFFDTRYLDLFADAIDTVETERAVNDLVSLVGVQPGWRVLDVPGGAGRHAVPLAMLGCQVTVVDRSPKALSAARAAAAATPGALRVVEADLLRPLDLVPEGRHGPPFDLVANLFNSFGYFADPNDDRRLLHDLARLVAPRGWLVMEVANPVAAMAQPSTERQDDRLADADVLVRRHVESTTQRLFTHYTISPRDGSAVTTTGTVQRLWSARELTTEIRAAGLVVEAIRGDLDGRPLTDHTDWLLIAARRP